MRDYTVEPVMPSQERKRHAIDLGDFGTLKEVFADLFRYHPDGENLDFNKVYLYENHGTIEAVWFTQEDSPEEYERKMIEHEENMREYIAYQERHLAGLKLQYNYPRKEEE